MRNKFIMRVKIVLLSFLILTISNTTLAQEKKIAKAIELLNDRNYIIPPLFKTAFHQK